MKKKRKQKKNSTLPSVEIGMEFPIFADSDSKFSNFESGFWTSISKTPIPIFSKIFGLKSELNIKVLKILIFDSNLFSNVSKVIDRCIN